MRKGLGVVLIAAFLVASTSTVYGLSSYATAFKTKYPSSPLSALSTTSGVAGNLCTVCHGTSGGTRNAFGSDFANSTIGNHTFNATLEARDSDGDGYTNLAEINAGTFPGDATSKPGTTTDTTPPSVTTFTIPTTATSLTVTISAFTATDNVGVTGYAVTESATAPTTGWSTTPPGSYTFASAGAKTLYGWARDAAGNTANRSASVTITLPTVDTTPPSVTTFTVPTSYTSLTVPISAFAATDNVGVTGYAATESSAPPASGWSATPPASYTFASAGTKVLYGWARDAAGNTAFRGTTINITLSTPSPSPSMGSLISPATSGLVWDDVNKRLGVGISAPALAFDMVGPHMSGTGMARFTGSDQFGFMVADTTANSGSDESGFLLKAGGTLVGQFGIRQSDNSVYIKNRVFGTNEIMTLTDVGNVGINAASPSQKLEINGGMRMNTTDTRPVCDSTTRGTFWFIQDDMNGDSAEVCAWVSGAFAWRGLF